MSGWSGGIRRLAGHVCRFSCRLAVRGYASPLLYSPTFLLRLHFIFSPVRIGELLFLASSPFRLSNLRAHPRPKSVQNSCNRQNRDSLNLVHGTEVSSPVLGPFDDSSQFIDGKASRILRLGPFGPPFLSQNGIDPTELETKPCPT